MLKINKKIDYHVHIGQWSNVYYSSESVLDSLKASNVEEVWFSSTSSCRYCKESFDVISKNLDYSNFPTALELYNFIKNEVLDTIEYGKKIGLKTIPLYWGVRGFGKKENIFKKFLRDCFTYSDEEEYEL